MFPYSKNKRKRTVTSMYNKITNERHNAMYKE